MAFSLLLSVAFLCLFTCYVTAHPKSPVCSDREVFVPDSMGCEPSCELPVIPKDWDCVHAPMPECVCKIEYLRADNGSCVNPIDCPRRECRHNEHFVTTVECELSCEYPVIPPGNLCSVPPISMCRCDDGTYRDNDNQCVRLSDCRAKPAKL